jgi:hypothetical protein
MTFNTLDLVVIILFFLSMVVIGIWSYFKSKIQKIISLQAENFPGGWREFRIMFLAIAALFLSPMLRYVILTGLPCTFGGLSRLPLLLLPVLKFSLCIGCGFERIFISNPRSSI